jgi:dihydroorotate dehydrogenase
MGDAQLLMVSVMGSPEVHAGTALASDFVRTARLAEEAGATAIELNLSCPNTLDPVSGGVKEGLICQDAAATRHIVRATRDALRPGTRLVAKFSYLASEQLCEIVEGVVAELDGISGINTVQMEVLAPDGTPEFSGTHGLPSARLLAGVSGAAIYELAMEFVRSLAALRRELGAEFDILAMGGVMSGAQVASMLAAGASSVQSASGAFAKPGLAAEVARALWQPPVPDDPGRSAPTDP